MPLSSATEGIIKIWSFLGSSVKLFFTKYRDLKFFCVLTESVELLDLNFC